MTDNNSFAVPDLSSPRSSSTTTTSSPNRTKTATTTMRSTSSTTSSNNTTTGGIQQPVTGEEQGLLKATILSVYDLPISDQPTAVTISCCGKTVSSGPPISKHKDRNSFRFSTMPTTSSSSLASLASSTTGGGASTSSSTGGTGTGTGTRGVSDPHLLKVIVPLQELYKSKVTIRVLFSNPNVSVLYAEYTIKELIINQSSWHIFTLKPIAPTSTTSAMTTSTTTGMMNGSSSTTTDIPPSIRIKLQLSGPYRPEIKSILKVCHLWFTIIDSIQHSMSTNPMITNLSQIPIPDKKYFLLPAVPVITTIVVASPVLAGITMVGLPFLLPAVLVLICIVLSGLVIGGIIYSSSQSGRQYISRICQPMIDSLKCARPLQKVIYNTGPRPTPVSVARQLVPTDVWGKLLVSLIIDLIGSSSYLLPIVGEGLDIGWAPIQTILVMAMYDTTSPNLKYVSFTEEILPFTDIVPTATIGWMIEFFPQLIGTKLANSPELTTMLTTVANQVNAAIPSRSTSSGNPQQANRSR